MNSHAMNWVQVTPTCHELQDELGRALAAVFEEHGGIYMQLLNGEQFFTRSKTAPFFPKVAGCPEPEDILNAKEALQSWFELRPLRDEWSAETEERAKRFQATRTGSGTWAQNINYLTTGVIDGCN